MNEEMTPEEQEKAEQIVMALKAHQDKFKERYGENWRSIMYAIANKHAQKKQN